MDIILNVRELYECLLNSHSKKIITAFWEKYARQPTEHVFEVGGLEEDGGVRLQMKAVQFIGKNTASPEIEWRVQYCSGAVFNGCDVGLKMLGRVRVAPVAGGKWTFRFETDGPLCKEQFNTLFEVQDEIMALMYKFVFEEHGMMDDIISSFRAGKIFEKDLLGLSEQQVRIFGRVAVTVNGTKQNLLSTTVVEALCKFNRDMDSAKELS